MKRFLVLALTAVLVSGCGFVQVMTHASGPQVVGSGKMATVKRTVGSFKAVQLDGAMDAEITIGRQSNVEIKGDDNIAPLVKTEVNGDTLRIYLDGSYSTQNNLQVKLSVPDLKSVVLNGSGDISVHQYSGSSLALRVRGSGSITADGTADSVDASISGSGDLRLYGLKVQKATVGISGSGGAQVTASGNLDVIVSGSGDVKYHGKPQVTKTISGSGDVSAG